MGTRHQAAQELQHPERAGDPMACIDFPLLQLQLASFREAPRARPAAGLRLDGNFLYTAAYMEEEVRCSPLAPQDEWRVHKSQKGTYLGISRDGWILRLVVVHAEQSRAERMPLTLF